MNGQSLITFVTGSNVALKLEYAIKLYQSSNKISQGYLTGYYHIYRCYVKIECPYLG
jgi:hypothetical protein